MAQHQIGSIEADGFVSKTRAVANSAAVTGAMVATPANYGSLAAIRTRLTAINGTYWTSARMDGMTLNDLTYALRTLDDAGTV